MKKIIIALALIFSIVICLPSCAGNNYEEEFNKLNTLADKDYSFYTIDIEVKNNNGDMSVKENYMVTSVNGTRTVKYSIERLNDFVVDGDNIFVPNDYMNISSGTLSTTEAEIDKYAFPKFDFSSKTLVVRTLTNKGTYSHMHASVTSFESFMGRSIEGSDGQINVYYNNNQINSIEISFANQSGNFTTITYTIQ